jgi:SHS2 domain-containing protein
MWCTPSRASACARLACGAKNGTAPLPQKSNEYDTSTDVTAVAPHWVHYEHGADIGVRGFGATRAQAFEQAALALTAVITDPSLIAERDRVAIECEAPDDALLLAEWLNAVVYEMSTRRMLFGRYEVRMNGLHLSAEACGERVDRGRHHPAVEVKGATYTTLLVARTDGGWVAQTVVDV